MEISALENIGLSSTEIKVFLKLLELGEAKSGEIISSTGLQSSSTYSAINSLISKGFVSYIKKNKTRYYRSVEPETILNYLDLKKNEYLKILPDLKAKQKISPIEGVEFFKSYSGIRTLILELIKDAKKGDISKSFTIEDKEIYDLSKEKVYSFTKPIIKEKKIIQRILLPRGNKYKPSKDSIVDKRYVDYPMPPSTTILNNKVAIISWDEEPTGILITSQNIAKKYGDFFDYLWKMAKK